MTDTRSSPGSVRPRQHDLKTWPEFFADLLAGLKSFDLRKKNDRDFRIGDELRLHEYDPATKEYSGRVVARTVLYMLEHRPDAGCAATFGLQPDHVILGLSDAQRQPDRSALTTLAAECHRAKWEFDLSEDYQPSKPAARQLIKAAFNALHRIGDIALKLRETASPPSPVAGEASLQKMQISSRNATIEECARVADRWGDGEATMAAAEIRMLKASSVASTTCGGAAK